MATRQQVLNDIFAEARSELVTLTKDGQKYQELLKNLILQGLYRLMENVVLRAREADYSLVQSAMLDAIVEYEKEVGSTVKIEVDKENPLPVDRYF